MTKTNKKLLFCSTSGEKLILAENKIVKILSTQLNNLNDTNF